MTKKKIMMAAMSAGLVAVVGVGGTLAYLSAQTDVVENTFAVGAGFVPGPDGDKGIVLDETKVDEVTGEPEGTRTTTNAYADLLPGDERLQDPTVWMVGGSVDSYVFVRIEGADALEEKGITIKDLNTDDWTKVEDASTEGADGIYIYSGTDLSEDDGSGNRIVTVADQTNGALIELSKVFENVVVDSDLTQEDLDNLKNQLGSLALQAVAVQADNNTATAALAEAKDVAGWVLN